MICVAGWMSRNQQDVIEYLHEEIRVLKGLPGKKQRFNDGQRQRLAIKGTRLGRKALDRFASLVTPNTLLAWRRRFVAQKYDDTRMRQVARNLIDPMTGTINFRDCSRALSSGTESLNQTILLASQDNNSEASETIE
jgi:hypothetical protein